MKAWLLLALLGACAGAGAQGVYKCQLDGKVSYGQMPCASGASVELAMPAAPAQSAADAAALARQQHSAERMRQERLRRDAQQERQQARAARAGAAQRQKCAMLELQRKWAAEDARAAPRQRADQANSKARRAAEKLAVACPA